MKKRPLIAITPSYSSEGYVKMKPTYLDAVWSAGGMPVFVAYTKNETKLDEYTALFDGFLFAGGVDIDPKYYGEDITSDEVEVCDARDGFELALFVKFSFPGDPRVSAVYPEQGPLICLAYRVHG